MQNVSIYQRKNLAINKTCKKCNKLQNTLHSINSKSNALTVINLCLPANCHSYHHRCNNHRCPTAIGVPTVPIRVRNIVSSAARSQILTFNLVLIKITRHKLCGAMSPPAKHSNNNNVSVTEPDRNFSDFVCAWCQMPVGEMKSSNSLFDDLLVNMHYQPNNCLHLMDTSSSYCIAENRH